MEPATVSLSLKNSETRIGNARNSGDLDDLYLDVVGGNQSFDSKSRHEGHPIPSDKPETALVQSKFIVQFTIRQQASVR